MVNRRVAAFIGIVAVHLPIVQGLGWVLTRGLDTTYPDPPRLERPVGPGGGAPADQRGVPQHQRER